VGEGLFRNAYAASVHVTPDESGVSGSWVVLIPGRDDDRRELPLRTRRELRLLAALASQDLPFRVPRPLGALPEGTGIALAREFIAGVPLDLREGRQPSLRPWAVVAEIAAGVHSLGWTAAELPWLPGYKTRRAHAIASLSTLEQLDLAEAHAALAWAKQQLPPDEPAVLLHGDLLGQNILIDPGATPPFALIDWEHAEFGDPAYDLAIVTRGVRRPFQVDHGLERLIEAYSAVCVAHSRVTREHVRIQELCLAARWCQDALAARPGEGREPLSEAIARLGRVLAMATGA
jgi:aminoglycoside phosphotransferase (APT) family kinase protein